jgi:glycosyltransferase involved in cell wall biosynthesis
MQRGGEDSVFETEISQLRASGATVEVFEMDNHILSNLDLAHKIRAGFETVWSSNAQKTLRALLLSFRPDVAHFHNTFPMMSPSVYRECKTHGVAVVQTLHNFRLLCAGAMFLRDGKICEDCIDGRYFNGVMHSCYRGSISASAAVVAMQYIHHGIGTYSRFVDRYIALTEFAKQKFLRGGLPCERLRVKPNSLERDPGVGRRDGGFALFVGRLSGEKGVGTLVDAWRRISEFPLVIAGDGPLGNELRVRAAQAESRVEFMGLLGRDDILNLMGRASLLVVPSEWYEGFPMTIIEAYAKGLPVIASDIGSLSEVVIPGQTGEHFIPRDSHSLATVAMRLLSDPEKLSFYSRNARQRYLTHYSTAANTSALLKIYAEIFPQPKASC